MTLDNDVLPRDNVDRFMVYDPGRLELARRRYKLFDLNTRLSVVKWAIEEQNFGTELRKSSGRPNDGLHKTSAMQEEIARLFSQKNLYQDGPHPIVKPLAFEFAPYYGAIFTRVFHNSVLRNAEAHEEWEELACIFLDFPEAFESQIAFWEPFFLAVKKCSYVNMALPSEDPRHYYRPSDELVLVDEGDFDDWL
ncbi:MAG: hypothetical protein MMC33_004936 [Icmadophila ericetorum]|nr:hypothetical protein [Icmadophila ericetorum]